MLTKIDLYLGDFLPTFQITADGLGFYWSIFNVLLDVMVKLDEKPCT